MGISCCKPQQLSPAFPADAAGGHWERAGDHMLSGCASSQKPLCPFGTLFWKNLFLFEIPCQPASFQCFREESALQKKSNFKRESMFHFETITLHGVQIEAMWSRWDVFPWGSHSNHVRRLFAWCLPVESHLSQPFPEVSYALTWLI